MDAQNEPTPEVENSGANGPGETPENSYDQAPANSVQSTQQLPFQNGEAGMQPAGFVPPEAGAVPSDSGALPAYEAPYSEQITEPLQPADPANSVGGAFSALWLNLKLILSGRLVDALATGEFFRRFWIVAVGCTIGIVGFLHFGFGVALSRGVNVVFSGALGRGVSVVDSAFGAGMQLFLMGVILAAIAYFARITALFLMLKVRGVPVTFGSAATVWGVANTPLIFVLAICAVFAIIPSGVTVGLSMILLALFIPMSAFMAEISMYVGINRMAPQPRSLLVPHTLFTGLAFIVTALGTLVTFELFIR